MFPYACFVSSVSKEKCIKRHSLWLMNCFSCVLPFLSLFFLAGLGQWRGKTRCGKTKKNPACTQAMFLTSWKEKDFYYSIILNDIKTITTVTTLTHIYCLYFFSFNFNFNFFNALSLKIELDSDCESLNSFDWNRRFLHLITYWQKITGFISGGGEECIFDYCM